MAYPDPLLNEDLFASLSSVSQDAAFDRLRTQVLKKYDTALDADIAVSKEVSRQQGIQKNSDYLAMAAIPLSAFFASRNAKQHEAKTRMALDAGLNRLQGVRSGSNAADASAARIASTAPADSYKAPMKAIAANQVGVATRMASAGAKSARAVSEAMPMVKASIASAMQNDARLHVLKDQMSIQALGTAAQLRQSAINADVQSALTAEGIAKESYNRGYNEVMDVASALTKVAEAALLVYTMGGSAAIGGEGLIGESTFGGASLIP